MDMNILKYLAFIKTVEYGSFTKAAEKLNYSQSGISRMINNLEEEWQVVLLERRKTGVKLTSDGMKLLPYAQEVCQKYEMLHRQVEELNGLQTGYIRIGTFSSVATHWLPNIIKEFQKDYPNIDYELLLGNYSEIEEWILEGRVDCGFLRLPTQTALDTVPLEQDLLLAVLPADHPLAVCDRFPVSAFCDEPFILLERGNNTEIAKIFAQFSLKPQTRFTTWDDYAVMSMVEKGLGISMLHQLILRRTPYHLAVKELDVPVYRSICFAVRDKKTSSLAVKKFSEYLKYR
ncbi:LysR family transcriptional regulator [Extibacter muris]|uniref:LysR family transcriptional regulator n=1 Tax=Extibacter muris TaxID=1796622 RepID=UPI001D05EE9D|nr:LysR family transcriptional regulator [Extibacter muris]MCB6203885.1 LysR family transcriptional regulator [Extibacter muris]MCQ4665658.1 LysR family transcriptional regulator [Extibacter muris]MCQ4695144.1 LysR family transcriptional regulator [Extibacter muris]